MSEAASFSPVWLWGVAGVFVYEALRYYRLYVQQEKAAQRITFYPKTYIFIFLGIAIATVLANGALGVSLSLQAFVNGYALPSGLGALIGKTHGGAVVEDFRVSDTKPPLSLNEALQIYWY